MWSWILLERIFIEYFGIYIHKGDFFVGSLCDFGIRALQRVECWSHPQLLFEVQCVLWTLVNFLLQMRLPLHLEHTYYELRVLLGRFFFAEYGVFFHVFFATLRLKVDFIQYWNGYSFLFPGSICLENCFPVFYTEIVFVFVTEVCFLYAVKWWLLFKYSVC